MQPQVVHAPPVVDLSLEGPGTQRRLTVAFRVILAVPHYFWMSILALVVGLAIAIGWLCALFTGRLPHGIREFIVKFTRTRPARSPTRTTC